MSKQMLMPRLSAIFLLIFHLLFEECSSQIIDKPVFVRASALVPRIVNGKPAELGDVPYQVGFRKRNRRVYSTFCGGTIIGKKKIVSAAHCFPAKGSACCVTNIVQEGRSVSKYYAVAATLLNQERYPKEGHKSVTQWRKVSMIVYPASYKFPKDDICVVVVKSAFKFNNYVNSVSYARSNEDYRGECLISGYGRISGKTDQALRSEILLHATVELLPNYYCNKLHDKNMKKFICTSSKVSDIGKGDSGGPLVCQRKTGSNKPFLVGVVSGKTTFRGRPNKGGSFFTRVSAYSKFIAKNETKNHKSMYLYYYFIVLYNFIR